MEDNHGGASEIARQIDPRVATLSEQIRDFLVSVHEAAKAEGNSIGGPMAQVFRKSMNHDELMEHFHRSALAMLGDIKKVFEEVQREG